MQPLFNKDTFPACSRSAEFGHQSIQFVDVGLCQSCRSLRIAISHADGNDSAFSIFRDLGEFPEVFAGILFVAIPVDFLQLEAVD